MYDVEYEYKGRAVGAINFERKARLKFCENRYNGSKYLWPRRAFIVGQVCELFRRQDKGGRREKEYAVSIRED